MYGRVIDDKVLPLPLLSEAGLGEAPRETATDAADEVPSEPKPPELSCVSVLHKGYEHLHMVECESLDLWGQRSEPQRA
jgi:hypothetical protein